MIFLDLFKNAIEDKEAGKFRDELVKANVHRGILLAKITIILELFFTATAISAYFLRVDDRFLYTFYLSMYLLMILVNAVFLLAASESRKKMGGKQFSPERWDWIIIAYMSFLMVWGSVISLADQARYSQLMAYMINLTGCSIFFYTDSKKMLIPMGFSSVLLMVGLPFFQKSSDILVGHYVNLVVLIAMVWVGSRLLYHHYCMDFNSRLMLERTNRLLESEIEQNRQVKLKLEKVNNELKELSLHDELTGIPNRRSLNNYIDYIYCYKISVQSLISVIMIDIDYFKQYNDKYGHNAGDSVLYSVAGEINAVVMHPVVFAARYGGEEFVLIALGLDDKQIRKLAEDIRKRVMELKIPHETSEISEWVTMSLGTATAEVVEKEDIFSTMELADKALYRAKAKGRNRVECAGRVELSDKSRYLG